eukprot:TRINITY_DN3622_c0_g1_i1.p1 TRINITY_DN3622_c0_g1~~TRINITY_DN3622_c0_g1_i1.p1  ORF type:complete len:195 (-),score=48.56 TRINITY_DN3622_c0_g1_i1:162-746(-)
MASTTHTHSLAPSRAPTFSLSLSLSPSLCLSPSLPQIAHLVALGWLFGMMMWTTFFAGLIMFKNLPRHTFGLVQSKLFPMYFLLKTLLSAALLWLQFRKAPVTSTSLFTISRSSVQVWALGIAVVFSALNWLLVGPATNKIMFARHKAEKDGKDDEVKKLSKKFGMMHGISSLSNLFVLIAVIVHGVYISTRML